MIRISQKKLRKTIPKENIRSTKIKNLLSHVMEETGYRQVVLSQRLKVSRQTIAAIESGRSVPSLQLSLHLARFFRVPVEEIFSLKESSP